MDADELIRRNAEKALDIFRIKKARLSLEIEAEIANKNGPLIFLLQQFHSEAVDALVEIIDVDPTKVDEVRRLQNEIKRYGDTCHLLHDAVIGGEEARKELDGDVVKAWEDTFTVHEEAE